MAPKGSPIPRPTGRLTVGRKINKTQHLRRSVNVVWLSCSGCVSVPQEWRTDADSAQPVVSCALCVHCTGSMTAKCAHLDESHPN
jgi:hypothetical protein